MNTIVEKLLETDREAQHIQDDAQQYLERVLEEIQAEKERLRETLAERAEQHIQDAREADAAEAAEAVASIHETYRLRQERLEETFRQNRAQWQQDLFRRCTGGLEH